MERERRSQELRRTADRRPDEQRIEPQDRTELFNKILSVPREERDRVQRLQLIDRAAAAIAAARSLLKDTRPRKLVTDEPSRSRGYDASDSAIQNGPSSVYQSGTSELGTPGPDFWSWSPPSDSKSTSRNGITSLHPMTKLNSNTNLSNSLLEKELSAESLEIPFESDLFESKCNPPLPPFQSLLEVGKMMETKTSTADVFTSADGNELGMLFSSHAEQAAEALLGRSDEASLHGVNSDGSKWWRETGTERRPDGVICKWTLTRGVSADQTVEWEDKFWEASDQFEYKELGSEKSGRDTAGNVWREFWKESTWQDLRGGLTHIEKTADKWGKNNKGDEWQEKWWEHYDASGQTEKWAHKWCCIDPNTPLDAGHAHVWHERWGEKYDGKGASEKYTDKWAERLEDNSWSKWGDKWDEHFGRNGHGVKQGETWWEGPNGERWNRTWGEQHNGSGWVHKYGKSSSGDHWDTHVQQDTWYERYPHYGFELCLKNSVHLCSVRKQPSETS